MTTGTRLTDPRIVITGGPGAGKTTLLDALTERYHCRVMPDSARKLIQQRASANLSPRPEPLEFATTLVEMDAANYLSAGDQKICFFERGVLDSLGMLQHAGGITPDELDAYVDQHRYNPLVFVLPPWREIYVQDSERDHSYGHAEAVFESITRWYRRWDYRLVELPKTSVPERVDFVVQTLARDGISL